MGEVQGIMQLLKREKSMCARALRVSGVADDCSMKASRKQPGQVCLEEGRREPDPIPAARLGRQMEAYIRKPDLCSKSCVLSGAPCSL